MEEEIRNYIYNNLKIEIEVITTPILYKELKVTLRLGKDKVDWDSVSLPFPTDDN